MHPESGFLNNMRVNDFHALASSKHKDYINAYPFPYACLDGMFDREFLHGIAAEFPALGEKSDLRFDNPNELKLASRGEEKFGPETTRFVHFLHSQPFLEALTALTGIQGLIPDPYFWGGGFHEIKKGGFLKIHADFNKHPHLNLDRRINLLIYLNDDWKESYGGHFELWDKDMKTCAARLLPVFNRMVIFNTTDYSYHGHPDPLTCPDNRSRRSIALYYYTNGRPKGEVTHHNRITTQFRSRENEDSKEMKNYNRIINLITDLTPPAIIKLYKKWAN